MGPCMTHYSFLWSLSDIMEYRPMFWASVDIHGCILFNFIVIIKIATNDPYMRSCVTNFWLCAISNLFRVNHFCKFGKFHCVCNLL